MVTISATRLIDAGHATFGTMLRRRLAAPKPLIEAAHNDPRFSDPPSTRRHVDPEPTIRMTRSELDEILREAP